MSNKVEKAHILNFRGIRNIEISLQGKNLLVLGENGTGKSSIIDAIEFFFTQKIDKFKGRGDVNLQECIPFANSKIPSQVKLWLSDHTEPILSLFAERAIKPNYPASLKTFFELAQKRPFILHRAQLTNFIEARPSERSERISELIGMGELDKIVNSWKKIVNDLEKNKKQLGSELTQSITQIKPLINTSIVDEQSILKTINARLQSANLTSISIQAEIKERQETVAKETPRPINFQRAEQLRQLLTLLELIETEINSLQKSYKELYQTWQLFIEKSGSFVDAPFESIILEGQKVLQEYNLEECPLCEQKITDRSKLIERLDVRVERMKELTQIRQDSKTKKDLLEKTLLQFDNLLGRLGTLQESLGLSLFSSFSLFRQIQQNIDLYLKREPLILEMPESLFEKGIMALWSTERDNLKTSINGEIEHLTPTEVERSMLDLTNFLGRVDENWSIWKRKKDQYEVALSSYQQADFVYQKLLIARREGINKVIQDLEKTFIHIYECLHPGEGHKAISIVMIDERANSADLVTQIDGMEASHPLSNFSEGHLDSLGLCIFLAFIQRFNDELKLLILDDVLTSIDSGHRMRVAQLIASEFKDYQIIITTHDEMWANELASIFKTKGLPLKSIHLDQWTRDSGASYSDYIGTDWEFYKELAKRDKKQDAIAGTGRSLEKFLLTMRKQLHLAVPATFDDRYMIGDLYPVFFDWVQKHKFDRTDIPDLWQNFSLLKEEFDSYWRLRNWSGAHYNDWGSTVSREEALAFIEIIEQLIQVFSCPACGGLVTYDFKHSLVHCTNCDPKPKPRIVWDYQPEWIIQAKRILGPEINIPNKEVNLVRMTQSAYERFLRDARRKFRISVTPTIDDIYYFEHLHIPVLEFMVAHPNNGYKNWENTLTQSVTAINQYVKDGRWLPSNSIKTSATELFELVQQIINLSSCSTCQGILSFDETSESYICDICQNNNSPEPIGAYWIVTK